MRRRHHFKMRLDGKRPRSDPAARISAVKNGVMVFFQMRRAFNGHRPAAEEIGLMDLFIGKAEILKDLIAGQRQFAFMHAEHMNAEILAQRLRRESVGEIEGCFETFFQRLDVAVFETFAAKIVKTDAGRILQRAATGGVVADILDLRVRIAKRLQRCGDGAVDDFEHPAASELLEFDEREIGFDAGRIAIHDETDRAGRRHHGHLRIAEAVNGAEFIGLVPDPPRRLRHRLKGAGVSVELRRFDRQPFKGAANRGAGAGAAVIAHDSQHVIAIVRELGEGAGDRRHFGRGAIGCAGHKRGNPCGDRAAFLAVISQPRRHQQAAKIGEAKAQGAVIERSPGDFRRRILRHHDGDFEGQRPEAAGMFKKIGVKAGFGLELQQVQRGEIAGCIVEKHIFRTRIGGADIAARRAGVPGVDRVMKLQARIGAGPRRRTDIAPERTGADGFHRLAIGAPGEGPRPIVIDGFQEGVGDAHRIVGVLAGDRAVAF